MGLAVAGNLYGIAATQHALARGRAAVAIPLQNAVTQVLPVLVFFLVYRPYVLSATSLRRAMNNATRHGWRYLYAWQTNLR